MVENSEALTGVIEAEVRDTEIKRSVSMRCRLNERSSVVHDRAVAIPYGRQNVGRP